MLALAAVQAALHHLPLPRKFPATHPLYETLAGGGGGITERGENLRCFLGTAGWVRAMASLCRGAGAGAG